MEKEQDILGVKMDQRMLNENIVFQDKISPIVAIEKFSATRIGGQDEFERSLAEEEIAPTVNAKSTDMNYSMQESLMQESSMQDYKEGDTIVGDVVSIEKEGVLVDVGYKSDGIIPISETNCLNLKEIEEFYTPGKKVNLKIIKLESREGFIMLSKKQADYEGGLDEVEKAFQSGSILDAKVENAVRGGLIVTVYGHRGFLPASHIFKDKKDELDVFVGKKLPVFVIDFDKIRKKIIVSNKNVTKQGKKETKDGVLDSLEAGMIVKGSVSSIKNFGVFVDLGGVEGLIHISELSWCRVNNPEEIVKVGQELEVFILGVDREGKKVSLGYKQLFQDPWVNVEDTYSVGDVLSGKVSKIVSFGAFIELEKGLEGLVHMSEITDRSITKVEDELRIGEPVKVKVLRIIPEEKKIGLSIKAVGKDEEKVEINTSAGKVNSPVNQVPIADVIDFGDYNVASISEEDDRLVEEVMEEVSRKKTSLTLTMDDVLNM